MDLHLNELDQHFTIPVTRKIAINRPFVWLKMGWADMMRHPAPSLMYGVIIAIIGGGLLLFSQQNIHLFTTAITGFLLLAPLGAAGIYELTSERDEGRETSFMQSIHDLYKNGGQLAFLGVILAMVAIAWERASAILFALMVPRQIIGSDSIIASLTGELLPFTIIWVASGFVLACFVFALTAVSIPLLADREVDSVTAMMTSLRAVAENIPAMIVWAAILVGLTAIGFATYLIGLVVIFPLLGHATWYAYKEMIE